MSSSDEQMDELKAWWEDYGRSVVVGVLVAVLAAGGWNFWQNYVTQQAEQASVIYERMLEDFQSLERVLYSNYQDSSSNDGKSERVVKLAAFQESVNNLKKEYSNTEYAQYARFLNAKYYLIEKDYAAAEKELKEVFEHRPNKSIELLASLRLARVMVENNQLDEALKIAEANLAAKGYEGAFLELAGDIYFYQGNKEKALDAYAKARELTETPSEQLNMKYFNLLSK